MSQQTEETKYAITPLFGTRKERKKNECVCGTPWNDSIWYPCPNVWLAPYLTPLPFHSWSKTTGSILIYMYMYSTVYMYVTTISTITNLGSSSQIAGKVAFHK